MEPSLQDIAARMAISDVIYRYSRGMDRMDRALALSCWHPGGTDDHAPLFVGSASDFVDWVFDLHADMIVTRHDITNILIDIDGNRAGSESYWQVLHRIRHEGDILDISARGRYLDTFENISGRWAIRHRQSVRDWSRVDLAPGQTEGSQLQPYVRRNNPDSPETVSMRDRQDYSYRVLNKLHP